MLSIIQEWNGFGAASVGLWQAPITDMNTVCSVVQWMHKLTQAIDRLCKLVTACLLHPTATVLRPAHVLTAITSQAWHSDKIM